jgi:ribosome-associated translation inhibitor RaiA
MIQVQVNTDRESTAQEVSAPEIEAGIAASLARFSRRITRVEVHLSDQNSHKGGKNDKRCLVEARLAGLDPIGVTHQADTWALAVSGAMDKLERSVEKRLGRAERR